MRKRGPTAYKKHEERVHSRLRQRPLHSNTSSCRVSTNSILNDFSFRENRGEKEPSEIQRNGSRKWKTNLEKYIKLSNDTSNFGTNNVNLFSTEG